MKIRTENCLLLKLIERVAFAFVDVMDLQRAACMQELHKHLMAAHRSLPGSRRDRQPSNSVRARKQGMPTSCHSTQNSPGQLSHTPKFSCLSVPWRLFLLRVL